jgi:hypothetical protein
MKWKLFWPVLLTIVVPLIVAWFVYPSHLPPGFGEFPPTWHAEAPGFSLTYFLVMLAGVIFIGSLIIAPKYFGFKGAPVVPRPKSTVSLPWWFWAGGLVMGFFWWLMWSHSTIFGDLVFWSFTPLWWGFIFFLDGIVYQRNNGASLFSKKPVTLLISGLVSILGWAYFEYYDYFVLGNWYYPNTEYPNWSKMTLSVEFLITYSTVTPVLFQWYNLLNTFPKMTVRYQNGPKMKLSGDLMIIVGTLLIAAMVYWHNLLFWAVWIGPFAVMTGILMKYNIWNPFTDIAKGNWTAGVLIGVSSLCNGFFWEMWNYGSMTPLPEHITNPNYWRYDIPYVNVIHIFSEMPLLGYFGYIPFGVLVWQVFIWSGKMFNFDSQILILPVANNSSKQPIAAKVTTQS